MWNYDLNFNEQWFLWNQGKHHFLFSDLPDTKLKMGPTGIRMSTGWKRPAPGAPACTASTVSGLIRSSVAPTCKQGKQLCNTQQIHSRHIYIRLVTSLSKMAVMLSCATWGSMIHFNPYRYYFCHYFILRSKEMTCYYHIIARVMLFWGCSSRL